MKHGITNIKLTHLVGFYYRNICIHVRNWNARLQSMATHVCHTWSEKFCFCGQFAHLHRHLLCETWTMSWISGSCIFQVRSLNTQALTAHRIQPESAEEHRRDVPHPTLFFRYSILLYFFFLSLTSVYVHLVMQRIIVTPDYTQMIHSHTQQDSTKRKIGPSQRPLPHNTQYSQQISIPLAGFEPAILASERPRAHALDRTAILGK